MTWICTSSYPSTYPIEKVEDSPYPYSIEKLENSPYPYSYPINVGISHQNGDEFG